MLGKLGEPGKRAGEGAYSTGLYVLGSREGRGVVLGW